MPAVVPPPDGVARFTVEIHYHADGASGYVTPHGHATATPFASWLELLRLLERPPAHQPTTFDSP
ncbi:MAG: hypothetical protein J2P15_19630 [Micromonosporaceae bacterium]|nr:hypothetical protein [Micromonosporaceae bacterium]